MICSTTYRTWLSVVGSVVMTLGTFSMLQASAPWDSPRGEIIGYHDADLARPADAAKLYKRIRAAAVKVCEPLASPNFNSVQRVNACVNLAVADAVAKVNHPTLNALHSATMGRWQLANERRVKSGA